MVKILEVRILNFRSYRNNENKLKKLNKINVIVGKNNVGKTNILRALYLFFNPNTYNDKKDENIIKRVTGGSSRHPKITLTFEDDELIKGEIIEYDVICDLNTKNNSYYKIKCENKKVEEKLNNSFKIKNYLSNKYKCVYLSTTDEDIKQQSDGLINDLILEYFKKQSRIIKDTIEAFEEGYKNLVKTFEDNISNIEDELSEQFMDMNDSEIKPKLSFNNSVKITDFILNNIKLQLDDTYVQDISEKGASIQRASLIMLSMYLLNEIYEKQNKLILLDEPEAFLYPLLENRIKNKLEECTFLNDKMQVFVTSHSRLFLNEMNNSNYSFYSVCQKEETKEFMRSNKDKDTNKYSIIEPLNYHLKYEILKNYGMLDEVIDYEYIIVCEGETDKNYISHILKNKPHIPQIRWSKYSYEGTVNKNDIYYNSRGAEAIPPILLYLDNISQIKRKVFVMFDGDEAGRKVANKINANHFKNLEIKKYILPNNKQIEDMVFSKSLFIDRVLEIEPNLLSYKDGFTNAINNKDDKISLIDQTRLFVEGMAITKEIKIDKIKNRLSNELVGLEINKDWLLAQIDPFIYNE
ncbi:MAG: AAA family ATPase [Bacillota bacterium]|nr:AAA family ATPase [Bacillota bacterium]